MAVKACERVREAYALPQRWNGAASLCPYGLCLAAFPFERPRWLFRDSARTPTAEIPTAEKVALLLPLSASGETQRIAHP